MNEFPFYGIGDAYLDLVGLGEALSAISDPDAAAVAAQVRDLAENELITSFMIQIDAEGLYGDAHGLSIFHPEPRFHVIPDGYTSLSFSRDTAWDEYFATLLGEAPPWRPGGRARTVP